MKKFTFARFALLGVLAVTCLCSLARAAEEEGDATPYRRDLLDLQKQIRHKLESTGNQPNPADFAPELAAFEKLITKYDGQPEAQAVIAFDRAGFTRVVLQDKPGSEALFAQVQKLYPGTHEAEVAGKMLEMFANEKNGGRGGRISGHLSDDSAPVSQTVQSAPAQPAPVVKISEERSERRALIGKTAPDFAFTWSSDPALTKLSDLRGKVVVLDFWSTFCAPCIASFPKTRQEVAHFAGAPVVYLGATWLFGRVQGVEAKIVDTKGDPAKEYALIQKFMKKQDMTWPVIFVDTPVLGKYGISAIPDVVIIDPAGKVRHAGLHPGSEQSDIAGKITAILNEFGLAAK